MKPVLIINVQVRTPMADFCSTLKLADLKNRVVEAVVDGDVLLLLVDKLRGGGRRNVVEGTVSDSRARLRRHGVSRELDILRDSIRVDLRAWRTSSQCSQQFPVQKGEGHVPNLRALNGSLVWAQHEQLSLILQGLALLLACLFWPSVRCMRLNSLDHQVRGLVDVQSFRELDSVEEDPAVPAIPRYHAQSKSISAAV